MTESLAPVGTGKFRLTFSDCPTVTRRGANGKRPARKGKPDGCSPHPTEAALEAVFSFQRTPHMRVSLPQSGYSAEVTISRPENTTAYTAGDAIGIADAGTAANAGSAILTFADIGPAGANLLITAAELTVYLAAIPASMTSFTLHLYNASPTAILDNAAWDLVAGDRTKHVLEISLGSPADKVSSLKVRASNLNEQVKLAEGSTDLYGILVTNGGYTPSSSEDFLIRLHAMALV